MAGLMKRSFASSCSFSYSHPAPCCCFDRGKIWPIRSLLCKHAVKLALPYHLFAVGVERIVNDPLGSIQCVIVLVAEMTKPFCDSLQAGSFGLSIQGIIGVRAVDDLAQQDKCGVVGQLVFFQDRLERAFLAVMV